MLGLFMKPIRGLDHPDVAEKRMAVADYRVVYCATHSLVARDVAGLAEPSLALTLPKQPTEPDDGLLTASEVAQLKLDADWVVLSTCNTAAADKPKAEALSGLARAFFYAGARRFSSRTVGRFGGGGPAHHLDIRHPDADRKLGPPRLCAMRCCLT
jgi:hypothetical protein